MKKVCCDHVREKGETKLVLLIKIGEYFHSPKLF